MTRNEGRVTLRIDGDVARIALDRPEARNALSFAMYDALAGHCDTLGSRGDLAAIVLQGAGGAFAAGTDIDEFIAIASGRDGLAYEARVEDVIAAIERLPVPTLALVDGAAMGGGLILATACDFRIVTDGAHLGVPVARTLGNTLSVRNLARLEREFGLARVRRMLLLSEAVTGVEAKQCGFALSLVAPEDLASAADGVIERLRSGAPGTIAASREALRRLGEVEAGDDDLVSRIYGGPDFAEGVRAFRERRKPVWSRAGDSDG